MWNRLVPFAHEESIFFLTPELLREAGVRYVLSDLDNTLSPYHEAEPSQKVKDYVASLSLAGIELLICSNNRGERVHRYAELLGVRAECFMLKPLSKGLKRVLADLSAQPGECLMVGDQITTDVIAANGAGIRAVLTDPLDLDNEPFTTRFNRLFDRRWRKKLSKKGLLKGLKEAI